MSDNHLSIDEIIERAERIKAEAEKQLEQAQKSLNEKTQSAIKEEVVDKILDTKDQYTDTKVCLKCLGLISPNVVIKSFNLM